MTDTRDTPVIAPCPFCGGEAALHENDWASPPMWSAYCLDYEKCGTHGPERLEQSEAIAAWNRRASPPLIDDPLGGLKDAFREHEERLAKPIRRRASPPDGREAAIEECAKVAEQDYVMHARHDGYSPSIKVAIAFRIRALAGKP